MKLIGYGRFSTEFQEESRDKQLTLMHEWAADQGHQILHVFFDEAKSGRTNIEKREEFWRMMRAAQQGVWEGQRFDAVLFFRLDRAFRNAEDQAVSLGKLRKFGMQYLKVKDANIDGPSGKMIDGILSYVNQYQAELTGEMVRESNLVRVMNGKWAGGPPPYGYAYDRATGMFSFSPHEEEPARAIWAWAKDGYLPMEIVRKANGAGLKTRTGRPWSLPNLLRMLRNPFAAGKLRYNNFVTTEAGVKPNPEGPQYADGPQPTYLSLVEWERIQLNVGRETRPHRAPHEGRSLLAGNIRCSLCGGPAITHSMTTGDAESGKYSYTCRVHNVGGPCRGWHRRGRHVELALLSVIERALSTLPASPPPEIPSVDVERIRKQLDALASQERRQMEAYEGGVYSLDVYRQRKAETDARRTELTDLLAKAEATKMPPVAVWSTLQDWINRWIGATSVTEKRKLIDHVLAQPVETDGKVLTVHLRELPHAEWPRTVVVQLPAPYKRL